MKVLIFILAILCASQARSENILVLCPVCSRSHTIIIQAVAEGLAERNHTITLVSSYKTPIQGHNIRDIVVMDGFDFTNSYDYLTLRRRGILGMLSDGGIFQAFFDGCHTTYKNQEFQKLLEETFDLVIIDSLMNHCFQGFAHRLKAPVIWSSGLPPPPFSAINFGNYLPPSFVPEMMLPFDDDMSFVERITNFAFREAFSAWYLSSYTDYEQIYRRYLGDDIPGIVELEANISLMLVNSHFTVNRPRPTMPDVVEIGGVHCRPGKALPADLEQFISSSEHGVILFSLGSIFKCEHLPEELRKLFLNTFSRLRQRVIWKWDHIDMVDLPPNVKTAKWLPVQDILAHPNTKLFITHGGLLSTQEAIYHGVPLIGIPLYTDQDANIYRYVKLGLAVSLEILGLKEGELYDAILTVLGNPSYTKKTKELSALFRDQPSTALETAVFWCEYVMRHKGALHLRSAARKLNFFQYHSLDVIGIIFVFFFTSLCLAIALIRSVLRKIFSTIGIVFLTLLLSASLCIIFFRKALIRIRIMFTKKVDLNVKGNKQS